jgi:tricorn protease
MLFRLIAGLLCINSVAFAGLPGYYRQPAIGKDVVVFSAEGDLWKVPLGGGDAQRMTTHAGEESMPAISPDGTKLAFVGQYEGPSEVYVMDISGGLPTRLTWDAARATVCGWHDGKIIASTTRFSTLPASQLSLIDPTTGVRELIPLAQAAEGVFDDAGTTLFFTRLAFQGSYTKRYKGGTVQNLWRYAIAGDADAAPLTADYPGTSAAPMWWKGRVYFTSDRDGTMEIWSCKPDGSDVQQHTHHPDMDVKSPALSNGRIVFQYGADLWLYDIAANTEKKIDIRLSTDADQTREKWIKKPMDFLTSAHLSPDGDRVVLTARGQVFVAPRSQGRFVEIASAARTTANGTSTSVRHRDARFLPDGSNLLSLSDAAGEVELWSLPANGIGQPTQLTSDGECLRWEAVPSPDGKWIAHHDKNQRLWLFNVAEKAQTKIDESDVDDFSDLRWSPDSKWLAYVAPAANLNRVIKLYSITDGRATPATTDRYDSSDPAWSPDGKFLYLISERHLETVVGSPWGRMAPEPFFDKRDRIYHIALKADSRSPFAPMDELQPKDDDKKDDEKKVEDKKNDDKSAKSETQPETQPSEAQSATSPSTSPATSAATSKPAKAKKIPSVEIDLEGLAGRLIETPIPAGNYSTLSVTDKRLLWMSSDSAPGSQPDLMSAEIARKDVKAKELVKGATGYELSLDNKTLLVRKREAMFIIDSSASAPASLDEKGLDLGGWMFSLTPRDEWRQMFIEAWRLERDYFYDLNMHGVDWKSMRDRYLPMVDRVSTRQELSDVISQMVGELSALHTFVRDGDVRQGEDRIAPATLGAQLIRDQAAGGYRVEHVYLCDPDQPELRSPLAKPSVNIKDHDIIEQINGVATLSVPDISLLLRNKAGKQCLVKVKSPSSAHGTAPNGAEKHQSPDKADSINDSASRDVIVVPISADDDADLRYHEWEYTRRLAVEKEGNGEIGYVHLRAMGGGNMAEFARGFYPVFNRKGLIIDVRHNRGGNIDSWVLSRLLRKAWFYWQPRIGQPTWNMQYAFRGHIAVLCNERTASDGEAFSEGIKRLKIGKVIGTRTWGGEIWLSSSNVLVDRGIATAAEIGVYGPEGIWLIEGHGVEPDMVVDNLPHATFLGKDAQLDAALEYLKQKIKDEPVEVPKAPKHPMKAGQ